MSELTILLVVLAVVLTIVTLVGHGIWVLLSAIFGGSRKSSPSTLSEAENTLAGRRSCSLCGAAFELNQHECDVCGWPRRKLLNSETSQAALRGVREQVERLARINLLDVATRDNLLAAVAEQEQRIVALASSTAASAEPAVADDAIQTEILLEPLIEMPPAPGSPVAPIPLAGAEQPAPQPVSARAHKYAESRVADFLKTAAAKDQLTTVAPTKPTIEPPKQREALSRLFAAFMEEKNIRWGELVGGLLIVGCSIALVISFWSAIAERPLLKFGLFNGVTAALFGVGFYTDRRWKIHTTSHGILLIATLLVPLNFLAIAAFTQASPPTDVLSLVGEGFSLAAFTALVFFAGRILVLNDAVPLTAGVMIPCLMQLLVRRFAEPATSLSLVYSLAVVPVASYLAATAVAVRRKWTSLSSGTANSVATDNAIEPVAPLAVSMDESTAQRLLKLLGLVSAATLLPLALLLYNVPPLRATLHWLSPLVTACGVPAILVGLLFRRRLTDRALTALQTTGIGVGAFGAMVMAASVLLAWPDPATLLPTALATAAIMAAIAWWFEIPAANVPAGLAFAIAWLLGFHLLRGDIAWLSADSTQIKDALLSATSGHSLFPLVILFGAIAWWLRRLNRNEDGLMYGLVAAITTAASLALLMWFGFARDGDPHNITWTLAIYALTALIAGVKLDRADVACAGSALLFVTLAQAIVFRFNPMWQISQPWGVSLLSHATLIAIGCALLTARAMKTNTSQSLSQLGGLKDADSKLNVLRPLRWSAQITAMVAAVWMVVLVHSTSTPSLAVALTWLAGVWMLLSVLEVSPLQFNLSQVALVLAILCAVTTAVRTSDWYTATAHPWLDPRFLELQGVALAIYCVAFAALRWKLGSLAKQLNESVPTTPSQTWFSAAASVANPPWPMVDRIVEVLLVALVVLVATYGVFPGVAQELSPTEGVGQRVVPAIEQFEIAGISHAHASDIYAWLLLAAVAGLLAVNYWLRRNDWRIIGLIFAAMTMCPLIAAHWEADVAVASALRWLTAAFFAAGSIALWWAQSSGAIRFATTIRREESFGEKSSLAWPDAPWANSIRDLLVAFVVLVYVMMGAYVAQALLARSSHDPMTHDLWWWVLNWALLAGIGGLLIPFATSSIGSNTQGKAAHAAQAWAFQARRLLWLLAVAPAAVLSTFAIALVLARHPLVGPEPGTWFQGIGTDVSYGAPLAIIALTFVGYAIRDRSSSFAFAAGLLFNVVATIAVLLRLARGGGALDAAAWITVTQVNAIVAGVVAVIWLAAIAWYRRNALRQGIDEFSTSPVSVSTSFNSATPLLLITQTALASALCIAFLAPATVNLALTIPPSAWAVAADGALGWWAVTLAASAAIAIQWRRGLSQSGVGLLAAAIVALISVTIAHWDVGNRLAYHTLLAGFCITAWLLPTVTRFANRLIAGPAIDDCENAWSSLTVQLFDIAAVTLAIWEYTDAASWWVVGALFVIGARNIAVAWHELRRGFVWFAAALVCVGTSIWWLDIAHSSAAPSGIATFFNLCWINAIAAAAMAIVSVAIEMRRSALASTESRSSRWHEGLAFHRFAAWAIVVTLLLTTSAGLAADLQQAPFDVSWPLVWAAWLAAAVAAAACAWDPAVRSPIPCLYCVGLLAVGIYLDGLNFHAPMFHWALALALAAYSLATSTLWSVRDRLLAVAARLGAPVRTANTVASVSEIPTTVAQQATPTWEGGGHGWLVSLNFLIGISVLLLVGWIELVMPNFAHRMVAAYAIGAQAIALALLARGTVRTSLQYLALVWGVFFAIAFGWAWLPPDFAAPWLHRLVVTVAALGVIVIVYGFGLVKFLKRDNEWTQAAARLVPPLAVCAAALLLAVLGMEVFAYVHDGSVPIASAALVAVALALAGLVAAALVAALVPGRDPLGLSERGRTLYVYIAEALAALLFLHIRVTMPWLFQGWFLRFWPLVVMAIAFVGVGLGEVFQRRRQQVLSEPLQNTGALLPLLPGLGFWMLSSEIHYSLLLLSIGVLYAALSVLRKSFLYGVLAAIAINGSLWFLLSQRNGLSLIEHPQLWLIPPALCALAAGYINRNRLTTQQSTALRYASAIVIYVSSTVDIFINGVSDAPWLPAVLAGLSILGVLAGILLRVRAFLYLGTAFLVVALMTIIWHAAIEQQRTWILWLAGIVTGALIIALFGLFEKRRDDVLRVVEELKHWQA